MRHYLQKLKQFQLVEKLQLAKYTSGNLLINSVSKNLIRSFELFKELHAKGITIIREGRQSIIHFYGQQICIERNSSDSAVFRQIFIEHEYRNVVELLKNSATPPACMVDAGANIGLTSLYLRKHFPELRIIALEPAEGTFNRLKRNIELNRMEYVHVLKKGLWSSSTKLMEDRSFRDGQDWSFRLKEAGPEEKALFETVSMADLLKEQKIDFVDLLKIDIEGGEDEVFSSTADISWLAKVRVITIEVHDEFNCRDRIESLLKENHFQLSHSGELTIGVNKMFAL